MRYLIGLVVIAAVSLTAFFLVSSHGNVVRMENESDVALRINAIGASAAYRELVAQESDRSSTEQHAFGHLFGRSLYYKSGVDGFSICDGTLLYGCFHEFIARAILDKGFSVVPLLAARCSEPLSSTACQHGIGHGLIAYLGYDAQALSRAMDECSKYPARQPEEGCFGGALMEMNLQTMGGGKLLSFTELGIHGMCNHVARQYRAICFFWLPQWWRDSHFPGLSPDDLNEKLGGFCAEASKNPEERTSCFKGVGYFAAPSAEFDRTKTKALCHTAARTPKDEDDCWAKASSAVHI